MENSIYIGLSRQMTLRTNMDIIANNVANVNTPGFRGQNMLFAEFISDPRGQKDPLSFVYDYGQYQMTDQGSMRQTENPLDVALEGPGFLGVVLPDGGVGYTRAGNFQLSQDGTLMTAGGLPVADANGSPITIPAGSTQVKFDDRGFISNQDGEIGQLMIAEFENTQELVPYGNTAYKTDAAPMEATNTVLKQGLLEGSNVEPVVEMTRMIDTLRSFQSLQRMLESENERLRSAIQKLTRAS
jgi:flagellar basal-body rod protein FlgF